MQGFHFAQAIDPVKIEQEAEQESWDKGNYFLDSWNGVHR